MQKAGALSVNIRCSGSVHKLTIYPDGPLILYHHASRSEEDRQVNRALWSLGKDAPKCMQVLIAWRKYLAGRLSVYDREFDLIPRRLHPLIKERRSVGIKRSMAKKTVDPLRQSLSERLAGRISREFSQAFKLVRYQGRYRLSGATLVCYPDMKFSGPEDIAGSSYKLAAHISHRWLNRVFLKGLSIVDGYLVLDVLARDGQKLAARALREEASTTRVRSYHTHNCIIVDGKLSWIDNNQ
jgi:hypothetical protein